MRTCASLARKTSCVVAHVDNRDANGWDENAEECDNSLPEIMPQYAGDAILFAFNHGRSDYLV